MVERLECAGRSWSPVKMIKPPPEVTNRDSLSASAAEIASTLHKATTRKRTKLGERGIGARPGLAHRLIGSRAGCRLFARHAEPEGRFEVISLVAVDRTARLAVDQENPVGQAGLEGEKAAVVEREIVFAVDLDEAVIQARLAHGRLEAHDLARPALDGDRLRDRRLAVERQPHGHVADRERGPR